MPTFYPRLSTLVPVESLPEELGFVKDGLTDLLDDMYYKDLQYSMSPRGDAAQYSLSLVAKKSLEIEVPGTGIFLVLNPGHSGTSEFPITLAYEWGILAWMRAFDLETFSFEPADFYQLALTITGLTERTLLDRALQLLIDDPNPINVFVDDVNAFYELSPPIVYPTSPDPLGEVMDAINAHPGISEDDSDVGLIVFTAYILDNADPDRTLQQLDLFLGSLLGGSVEAYILKQIIPKVDASLELSAGLRFPRTILIPLDGIGGEPLPDPAQAMLTFDPGPFFYRTEGGIGYDETLGASLDPAQIGNTGFEIEITEARLDISRTTNIPEATADGRPDDFVGVFVEKATLKLPPLFHQDDGSSTAAIVGRKLLIGTGGLSGSVGLEALDPNDSTPALIKGRFGTGFEIGLSAVSLDFQQNAITGSEIKGYMLIPGFKDAEGNDAEIMITVDIDADGDFSVTAAEEQGIRALSIPDVLDLNINSLSVGIEDDRFFVAVGCTIDFADQTGGGSSFIGNNLPKDIEIQKLIIWEDGNIELEGGSIELRKPLSMKVGPVDFSITALHFGSHEQVHAGLPRQYRFFGFDGGLSVKPGGVDARGDGIKFYFTVDNDEAGKDLHVFLRIESIAIDLVIPGDATPETAALLISGYLSMKEPAPGSPAGAGTEYTGGIAFTVPALKLGGSAAMKYNPNVPSFLIDVGLELPVPIPLGPTGLGLYGFRGLFGSNYVATKEAAGLSDDAAWYEYYKAKISPDYREGIKPSKFEPTPGFSIGAGVSLATAPDSGLTFSAKVFFLLSLPEVFLIEGQGQILRTRVGLDTTSDPPFYAFIAITDESVETALGVSYKLPEEGSNAGKIVDVGGTIEIAFFFGDSLGWYINLGRDKPEEKRIRASLLTLFDAYFYMMISASGIRSGAGIDYHLEKKFGPLKAELRAWLSMYGEISFKPVQVGGGIEVGGSLELSLFGIGYGFSAEASLSAEAPTPFVISGQVKACVKVLWEKYCAKFSFNWTFSSALNLEELPLLEADPGNSVKAVHIKTEESFPLYAVESSSIPDPDTWPDIDQYTIPLDCFIDIEFKKGVAPDPAGTSLDKIGGLTHAAENAFYVSPKEAKYERVRHQLWVDDLFVKIWNEDTAGWEDYDIYDAVTAYDNTTIFVDPADLGSLKTGYWQDDHPSQYNKIRLLSQTPLSYLVSGSGELRDTTTELFNLTVEDIFCEATHREAHCVRPGEAAWVDGKGRYFPDHQWVSGPEGILFRLAGERGELLGQSLLLRPLETFSVIFPEDSSQALLSLETLGQGVRVHFYEWRRTGQTDPNGNPVFGYWVVETRQLSKAQLAEPVIYENDAVPIRKVVVQAGPCAPDEREPECEGQLTKEAILLETFLDALARHQDLTAAKLELYPKYYARYKYPFFHGALYGNPVPGNAVIYQAAIAPETRLHADLFDQQKYKCHFTLEIDKPDPDFSWSKISAFKNLRPDPNHLQPGDNFHFLVDAVIITPRGARVYTLRGHTCYLIIHCERSAGPLEEAFAGRRRDLEHILQIAHRQGQLQQTRFLNIKSGKYSEPYQEVLKKPSFTGTDARSETYFESDPFDPYELRMRVWDRTSFRHDIHLRAREPVDYSALESIGNVRTDPERQTDNQYYYFLVDAQYEGKALILMGRSGYFGTRPDVEAFEPKVEDEMAEIVTFLELAARNGQLVQTRYLNLVEGKYSALYEGLRKLNFFREAHFEEAIYFESDIEGENLHLKVWDKRQFRRDLYLRAAEGAEKPRFEKITTLAEPHIPDFFTSGPEQFRFRLYGITADGSRYLLDAYSSHLEPFVPPLREPDREEEDEKPETDCSKMSPQSEFLVPFLNKLIEEKDIRDGDGVIRPDIYDGYFWGTPLYTNDDDAVFYQGQLKDPRKGWYHLYDESGYECTFRIQLLDDFFTLARITYFKDLRPDPKNTEPGIHYCFYVTAVIEDIDGIFEKPVRICSCYPIYECVEKVCHTRVKRICYMTQEDYAYNETIPTLVEVQADNDDMIEGLNKTVQPVWRPNSTFAIHLKTRDSLQSGGTEYPREYVFGFRTGGGIGFYHNFLDHSGAWRDQADYAALLALDEEDSFKLAKLQHYLDFSRSFPNADGRITNAKPLYYINPELLLFFNEPYVYLMYTSWGAYAGNDGLDYELQAIIKDPVDPPESPSPFIVGAAWEREDDYYLEEDVSILNSMILPQGSDPPLPCTTVTTIYSFGINSTFIVPELKPLKMYTAIFNARYKKADDAEFTEREVHRYVFQTSRYGNFEEHIHSYRFTDEEGMVTGEAVFDLEHPVPSADRNVAQSIINGSMPDTDPLVGTYALPYERLTSGVLKLGSLPAAETIEFNIVRDGTTILGILVRSPEPFNDPKLPETELADTITLSVDGGPTGDYTVLHAADRSAAWIAPASGALDLPEGSYQFTFNYKQFDGSAYQVIATVSDVVFDVNL